MKQQGFVLGYVGMTSNLCIFLGQNWLDATLILIWKFTDGRKQNYILYL